MIYLTCTMAIMSFWAMSKQTNGVDKMKAVAYVGQFIDGQLYSSGKKIVIPEGQQVAVTFLGNDAIIPKKMLAENRRVAATNFLQAMQELRDTGFSDDDNAAIDELQSGKYKPHFEERLK